MNRKLIGGFFELALDAVPAVQDTLWQRWTNGAACTLGFVNARSGLYYLLKVKKPSRLWLPSYVCADIAGAPAQAGIPVSYFPANPVDGTDLESLAAGIRPGEAVLLVNYFGTMPDEEVRDFVYSHPGIRWIEDRCQMAWSEDPPYGDWLLYSPRKLCGVPDGGLLVGNRDSLSESPSADRPAPDRRHLEPLLMRYEDESGTHNSLWYERYKASEQAMATSLAPMSRLSREMLRRLPAANIIAARRANAAALTTDLAGLEGLEILQCGLHCSGTPFCVPVRVEDAAGVGAALARRGIFCPRHWPQLAAPESDWPDDWKLASAMLSLPCDQRYSTADMKTISNGVKDILRK